MDETRPDIDPAKNVRWVVWHQAKHKRARAHLTRNGKVTICGTPIGELDERDKIHPTCKRCVQELEFC